MLQIRNLRKTFGRFKALDGLDWAVPDGQIVGLIGSNGAGKSTLLRCISEVYSYEGEILYNNEPVTRNKEKLFFVSDEPFYVNRFNTDDMKRFYQSFYGSFDEQNYVRLLELFHFDARKPIHLLSKGLKRQSALILALSCKPSLLIMDESFDGLDPLMRLTLKRELIRLVSEETVSVIISSHNIRELEDICDAMSLLENHRIEFTQTLDQLNNGYHKLQLGYSEAPTPALFEGLTLLHLEIQNKVVTVCFKGEEQMEQIKATCPLLVNPLPLSMEEIFVSEMEAKHNEEN